jgi:hypothetical protein
MLKNQIRLLNEVCEVGKLEEFRHTLNQLFDEIGQSGCKVSARYDVEYSNIQDSIEHGSHIRISLKNVGNPIDIIWKLLHEYGHFLSGNRKVGDSILQREELAWSHADNVLKNYPQLILLEESYDRCKEKCLNSYRLLLSKNQKEF